LVPSANREPSDRWKRRDYKNWWSREAYDAWLEARMPRFQAVEIQPVHYVYRERDEDNNSGLAMKGILDGLKGYLVRDDNPRLLRLLRAVQIVDRKNKRTELIVRPVVIEDDK
jgi:hypothetical protein